jgi:hypothetical protein
MQLVLFALLLLMAACSLVTAAAAPPKPPLWDPHFSFVASVKIDAPGLPNTIVGSNIFTYDWQLPASRQILTLNNGANYEILNVGTKTWRVNRGAKQCCLCTEPATCGGAQVRRARSIAFVAQSTVDCFMRCSCFCCEINFVCSLLHLSFLC